MTAPTVRLLGGFDDLDAATWDALRATGGTDEVFQTLPWMRAWWASFGRGRPLLALAERAGRPIALAPCFADGGMTFLVGAGGSDYLDLLGDTWDPVVLDMLLRTLVDHTPGFVGMRFHLVPEGSPTGPRLLEAARRLDLEGHEEGDLPAPFLDLARPGAAEEAAHRDGLRRAERRLAREGPVEGVHARDAEEILPHLDTLLDMHVARWQGTLHPSPFLDPSQRDFYRAFVRALGPTGCLRFTRILWRGVPVACHLGFRHGARFLWYKPAFDPALARWSPGNVLLRRLLLAAAAEGATVFDFGLGDEPFKSRFADGRRLVRTYGLYPRGA